MKTTKCSRLLLSAVKVPVRQTSQRDTLEISTTMPKKALLGSNSFPKLSKFATKTLKSPFGTLPASNGTSH